MASLLDSAVKKIVAQSFKGKLSIGSLRRTVAMVVDNEGVPVAGAPVLYPFEGIRDNISAYFAAQAGIPLTDVVILFIAGSMAVEPQQDDKVFIRDEWFQLRRLITRDPANAHFQFAAFRIPTPT